ncbi:MAG: acyltransferase [Actinobacteria bacterium]|nr:acyltransferase [Actinomycetota bacterium]
MGALCVAVFFVISGFLLYRPFVLAALGDRPAPRVGRFYLRRALRIFPAYWLALTFYLFVFGPDQARGVGDALVYYGLAQNYRSGSLLLGLGVAWTLAIEVSFYVVLPALAAGFRALSNAIDPLRRLRGQLAGLAAMYVIGVAVRAWAVWSRGHIVESHGEWHP